MGKKAKGKKTTVKKAAVKKAGKQPSTKAVAMAVATDMKEGKTGIQAPRQTLQELKRQVKETWPEAKNLADARRKELAALIERGDAELFQESQTLWKKRSKERHDAWLKGDSKSAQGVKAKKES